MRIPRNNFTNSKESNFFKGICKKPLLLISKFIYLGSLMQSPSTTSDALGQMDFKGMLPQDLLNVSARLHHPPAGEYLFRPDTMLQKRYGSYLLRMAMS